jgi:hypothetical protein
MKCVDGTFHDSCAVHTVLWNISQTQSDKIEAALQRQLQNPALGVQVLVKGRFQIATDFLLFSASEVWAAQVPTGNSNGTFVQIFEDHQQCITAPCPTYEENKLNSALTAATEGFAFTSKVSSTLRNRATVMAADTGVVVAGGRGTFVMAGGTALYRYTNQIYLPVK